MTSLMRFVVVCAIVAACLYVVAFARAAIRPEPHPSCHCRAHINAQPYWFRTVWRAKDGTSIYVKCRVARSTRCWIVRIG